MSTDQTATAHIANQTNSNFVGVMVLHNSTYANDTAMFTNIASQTSSSTMTINFQTGFGSYTTLDYWSVVVYDGSGIYYVNAKECQLQSSDVGSNIPLTIAGSPGAYTLTINLAGACSTSFSQFTN